MKLLFNFFAYLVVFTLIVIAIGDLSMVSLLFDFPSILPIIGGLLMVFINFKFSEVFFTFRAAFISENNLSETNYLLAKKIIQAIEKYTLNSALISFIIALIFCLSYLESFAKLGPTLALTIFPLLYAFFLRLFLLNPINIELDKKILKD